MSNTKKEPKQAIKIPKDFNGYSKVSGKLWKVRALDILSVEEKLVQTFDADARKKHIALDSAIKKGMVLSDETVMLICVDKLEKVQILLDWRMIFAKKPKSGDHCLMFYGRFGYTYPRKEFLVDLEAGLMVDT